jgi:hypothetical protein
VLTRLRRGVDGMLLAGTTTVRLRGLAAMGSAVPVVRGRRVEEPREESGRSGARGDVQLDDGGVGRCDAGRREVGRRAPWVVAGLGDGSRLVLQSWPGAVASLVKGGGTDAYRSGGRRGAVHTACGRAVATAGMFKDGNAVGSTWPTSTMTAAAWQLRAVRSPHFLLLRPRWCVSDQCAPKSSTDLSTQKILIDIKHGVETIYLSDTTAAIISS